MKGLWVLMLACLLSACDFDSAINKLKGKDQQSEQSGLSAEKQLANKELEYQQKMAEFAEQLDDEIKADKEAAERAERAIQEAQKRSITAQLNQHTVACVNPEMIAHLKFAIADEAVNAIDKQKLVGIKWLKDIDMNEIADHIHSSHIELQYIKELADGSCSATAVVSYSDDTKNPVSNAAHLIKNSGYPANGVAQIGGLFDVNEFNINELRVIDGNTYSGKITYAIQNSYTENGESQQSYAYNLGQTSRFLATLTAIKEYGAYTRAEKRKAEKELAKERDKAQELAKKEFFENGPQWKREPNLHFDKQYDELNNPITIKLTIKDNGDISNVEVNTGNAELDMELINRFKKGKFYSFSQFNLGEITRDITIN